MSDLKQFVPTIIIVTCMSLTYIYCSVRRALGYKTSVAYFSKCMLNAMLGGFFLGVIAVFILF